jgi:hypothetical protein
MNMHPHDSLSPEEQALAERLRRLGGADGPSAALDARVLAAARAAAAPAPARRRRRLVWSAIPGGAMTAVGTAAAFVLAVGLVWQLRPDERSAPVRETARDDGGFVPVEMIERQARPPAALEPAPSRAAGPEPAQRSAPSDARARAPAAGHRTAVPPPAASVPGVDDGARRATVVSAPDAEPGASPSMPAEVAPAVAPGPAAPASATAIEAEPGPTGDARPPVRRRPTYTSSARAQPETRSQPSRLSRQATAGATRQDEPGSMHADDLGPVGADVELAPADWVQRIRERRERGDFEGAAESLRRFRGAHPRVRLPDDLRALAE